MKTTRSRLFYVVISVLFLVVFALTATPYKSLAASWEQVNTDGFGDATNTEAIRMANFNDQIYACVGNLAGAGVRIFRYDSGTTWTQVNITGFGDADNVEGAMIAYNSALYVGTINGSGFEVWKSTNGTTWTQVGTAGFGDTDSYAIEGMTVFNGKLYLGAENHTVGAQVYQLNTDDSFAQVNADGFDGTVLNWQAFSMDVFSGTLYVGTFNPDTGGEIWSTPDGITWSKVVASAGGFGDDNNMRITTLFHFNGYIYAGTLNDPLMGGTGTELWRSSNGSDWTQANTDGFGDANNAYAGDQVTVVNGTIYLGTGRSALSNTGARLLTSTDGTNWTQEGSSGFGDVNNFVIYATTFNGNIYIGFSNDTTGVEIWQSGTMDILSISTTSLGDETVGSFYSAQLQTSAGTAPITYSIASGSLPDGQTLNSTGTISGTPTKAGTYVFTVSATDSGSPQQLASRQLSINVVDPPAAAVAAPAILPETGASGYPLFGWINNLF